MYERYQEKPHWSDYNEARKKVCEIYGVDPSKVNIHHIIFRYDCLNDPIFANFDLNQLSNLYPFGRGNPEPHTTLDDHDALHKKVGEMAYRTIYQKRR